MAANEVEECIKRLTAHKRVRVGMCYAPPRRGPRVGTHVLRESRSASASARAPCGRGACAAIRRLVVRESCNSEHALVLARGCGRVSGASRVCLRARAVLSYKSIYKTTERDDGPAQVRFGRRRRAPRRRRGRGFSVDFQRQSGRTRPTAVRPHTMRHTSRPWRIPHAHATGTLPELLKVKRLRPAGQGPT